MMKTKKLRILREIYAGISEVDCKGLCIDQCVIAAVEAL